MNLQAELSYFKPYFYNADTSLMSKIFYRDFGSYQVPLAIERRVGLESTVAHRMKSNPHVTSTFSLGIENIDVSEGDKGKITNLYSKYNIPISERAKQLEGGLFLSLSPALLYDTRDNATVTRKGTMASIRFDEEVGVIDFDKTHGKLTGMVKQYIPVGKKSSLSFTAKGGGKIHGDNMPEVMAYRLGGPYTVRGFKMSGVGTGDAFIMGSAEFATPIPFLDRTRINFLNNLRFTVWADAGKIFNPSITDKIYDRPLYAVSAGVGLKLYIPGMGPLSIDYGIPLTNPGDNGNRNGYFTFGVGDIMYYYITILKEVFMKKFKLAALLMTAGLFFTLGNQADAAGVGYINYQKVQEGFPFAQQAVKEVDAKALEMQQYMVDKEKQYKSLDTPLKKQNFEEQTAREFKLKEEAYMRLKAQKEEQIFNKIQAATKQVLVEQKLDAIVDYRVIFVGGVDVTDTVLQKLKSGQIK